ncbi:hypothetical protein ACFLYS_01790 [Chloroflexota bacterium]
MRIVRIAAPFVFSAVLFILSYISLDEESYIWLVFLAIGVAIALLGVLLSTID